MRAQALSGWHFAGRSRGLRRGTTDATMSPLYIPPRMREEICRLLAERWETGEMTLQEIATEVGVSYSTVNRENYGRVTGAAGMDAALARRKAAIASGGARGPKPGAPNAGPPFQAGPDSRRARVLAMKEQGDSISDIAATEGISRQAVYKLLKPIPAAKRTTDGS